ncbi:hypothetical protein GR157_14190 [Burkholderia sp. 4701]|nr:hypothetical protein [Burkholderia sp. 4701]MXN82716.1 hypothetical protein [Burkholderia sp. 4812]
MIGAPDAVVTPFGLPVEPDVSIAQARSSGLDATSMPLRHAAILSRKSGTVAARRTGFGGRRFVGLSRLSVTDALAAGCSNDVGILARKRSFNVSSGILSWRSTACSHTSAKRSRAAEADAFPE